MKYIEMENWSRKAHFEFFNQLDYPHFNLCAHQDMTTFYTYIKEKKLAFFRSILYLAVRVANEIPEFRYRIRDGRVIEHELVHPAFTVLGEDDTFSFCRANFSLDFESFYQATGKLINQNKKQEASLEEEPERDDWLFITSVPWVSFTGLTHPIQLDPVDSVPRIAFGKYYEENGLWKLPLSVQAHHALLDGLQMGRYFQRFQEYLDQPETLFQCDSSLPTA